MTLFDIEINYNIIIFLIFFYINGKIIKKNEK